MTHTNKLIDELDEIIKNPNSGLPEEVFLFTSRITPIVNVDLIIRNNNNETLLTWRGGDYYSPGWHIPGGIVRYKESMHERI
ncbi:MAG: NUDIX domain-containing protein, partial [Candidatus Thioglobus sp.]